MTKITHDIETFIIRLYERGVTLKTLSESFMIAEDTIYRYLRRKSNPVQYPNKPRVYSKALKAFHLREIIDLLEEFPKLSLKDIKTRLDLPCCTETLRKFLVTKGFMRFNLK